MKIPAPWSEPSPPAHRPVAAGFVLIAAGMLTVARLGAGAGLADLMPGFVLVLRPGIVM
jgi:hypothetical protein